MKTNRSAAAALPRNACARFSLLVSGRCLPVLAAAILVRPATQAASMPGGLSAADWTAIQQQLPPIAQQAYLKASNTGAGGQGFGQSVAVSGNTVVVGAPFEHSNATGVNGDQNNIGALLSGAAYVFVRSGMTWNQQAYLEASNTGAGDEFGSSVAVSGDTIVVGAVGEESNATGVNGDQADNSAPDSGAAYVFVRNGTTWSQQAYLKGSNTEAQDEFGFSVAMSSDTVVVGAIHESSNATEVNGDQSNNGAVDSGAAYVFVRNGTIWTQQAYLKASNTGQFDEFGISVAISGDTVVVGAFAEDSIATGVNGSQNDNSAQQSGAAYVFVRSGTNWSQQAYLKASNNGRAGPDFFDGDEFGASVAASGDTVVVGSPLEDSSAAGVNGNQSDNGATNSGAAYVFVRTGTTWSQQAYLKASNTGGQGGFAGDAFGSSVAVSGDTIAVGASWEASSATGVNGDQSDNSAPCSGAAYVFVRNGTNWSQQAYLKASNTDARDGFGSSVAVSGDTLVVGAFHESSNATGVDGNQSDNSAPDSGAAYIFTVVGIPPESDGDGVPDAVDECPNTPAGAMVDATGCSIEQLVPCDAPWHNHGEYVRALHGVISYFVEQRLLTTEQGHAVFKQGAMSDCAKR